MGDTATAEASTNEDGGWKKNMMNLFDKNKIPIGLFMVVFIILLIGYLVYINTSNKNKSSKKGKMTNKKSKDNSSDSDESDDDLSEEIDELIEEINKEQGDK
jgi:hypothetical protein